ncbi:tricarballylate utilization 4Fe-4S protein TcuB [Chachezhania sediminis]|uniref:tricarballylate utilization 4Fe-4S protein TcuB n=1 Tax=Chachezhania sediminis TaxID=2599291 RepID=UPI00131BD200|nr:tricarballylate utilization 4Fe-4S protein TcuB [Chachezhania sediminis]
MSDAGAPILPHATPMLAEADRLMTVCNSCRYCEGICPVFPAMELRRAFHDADLRYLANLCHNCGACHDACQFSPPHEFDVNVPQVLAKVRNDSYAEYAWPAALQPVFRRNGLWIGLGFLVVVSAFLLGMIVVHGGDLFTAYLHPENFYALMPHNVMAALFGAAFLYMLVAIGMGALAFWRDLAGGAPAAIDLARAGHQAARLTHLDGGGPGCAGNEGQGGDPRKLWHHLTFYGFGLCFAATCIATLYHYLLGREAPYPYWDLPVVLGTLGGIGLVVGPVGLFLAKMKRPAHLWDTESRGMDVAFIAMLFATGLTGLLLAFLRHTPAMGPMLVLHLGAVMTLFLTMPYGKFVHGIYRGMALARNAWEQRRAGH